MTNTLSDYSMGLVLLSYIVSVIGSLAALYVATNVRQKDGKSHMGWLAVGAIMLGGCAIWSMHFIGMVAYEPGVPMFFDTVITGVSLIIPIAFTFIGLTIAFRGANRIAVILLAGLIMGVGVASMHYTGMAAIRIEAYLSYDPVLVAISVVIAVVASAAALLIVVRARGVLRYASALVMGLAVCGMHYTGMAAMSLEPANVDVDFFTQALPRDTMLFFTVLAFLITCVVGFGSGALRRLQTA
ncbi:MAG: hypothetical protein JJU31_10300 [Wenzhouxiangella sp.]|nr:hypothetical protein [Wenzhouxiangella sp.]MCH8477271.1 hypothetical protein [Wenzhouxiangella sp.]TVR96435.1 MAG: hypothetical protein EA418_05475 [Wenzhouxiangellaceae bacterium]